MSRRLLLDVATFVYVLRRLLFLFVCCRAARAATFRPRLATPFYAQAAASVENALEIQPPRRIRNTPEASHVRRRHF